MIPESPSPDPPSTPPLEGVVVLDLSRALAAPLATMMLADLGATVLKVEHTDGGDQSRSWGTALAEDVRTYFFTANRSKRSIAIDLSRPEGAELVRKLAGKSDVLVENFMRRSLPKYGLDQPTLTALYPRLIYCSLSGYGRTGPMADRPGYDTVIQAESGIMSVTGEVDGDPVKVGMPVSDTLAGIYTAQAVLAALLARSRTGRGQFIDISMLDCSIAALVSVAANAVLLDRAPARHGNGHADVVPQSLYPAQDGKIVVHIGTDAQFRRFCIQVLDDPGLADDPRFVTNAERTRHRHAIDTIIAGAFVRQPKAYWIERLQRAEISAGVVRNVLEAVQAPEVRARNMVVTVDHPVVGEVPLINSPLRFSESRLAPPAPPPLLGQHTDAVLDEFLGMDESAIAALKASGVIA